MADSDAHLVSDIQRRFSDYANPQRALGMRAYMRNRFEFVGLESPLRKKLQREVFSVNAAPSDVFSVAESLWLLPQREYQYAACDLLRKHFSAKKLPKVDADASINRLKRLVVTKSWWDTIDALAPVVLHSLVTRYSGVDLHNVCNSWIRDANFWVQRSALLCQLKAKDQTDADLLFSLVLHVAHDKEFFLRKGAGWALREYSKTNPSAVRTFIDKNIAVLSPLTIKEGGKYC